MDIRRDEDRREKERDGQWCAGGRYCRSVQFTSPLGIVARRVLLLCGTRMYTLTLTNTRGGLYLRAEIRGGSKYLLLHTDAVGKIHRESHGTLRSTSVHRGERGIRSFWLSSTYFSISMRIDDSNIVNGTYGQLLQIENPSFWRRFIDLHTIYNFFFIQRHRCINGREKNCPSLVTTVQSIRGAWHRTNEWMKGRNEQATAAVDAYSISFNTSVQVDMCTSLNAHMPLRDIFSLIFNLCGRLCPTVLQHIFIGKLQLYSHTSFGCGEDKAYVCCTLFRIQC